jgi:hypothetical protein
LQQLLYDLKASEADAFLHRQYEEVQTATQQN